MFKLSAASIISSRTLLAILTATALLSTANSATAAPFKNLVVYQKVC